MVRSKIMTWDGIAAKCGKCRHACMLFSVCYAMVELTMIPAGDLLVLELRSDSYWLLREHVSHSPIHKLSLFLSLSVFYIHTSSV